MPPQRREAVDAPNSEFFELMNRKKYFAVLPPDSTASKGFYYGSLRGDYGLP